ncbi:hypothetical protein Y032_0005g2525 [Ancylostoma ceylanicum]|uniref:Uncharacterized protein n=1 Tax=Ancylostoma ceylanicum TaxID=53326 RepID=A0A016VRM5_9BILA|nr:hypothetical protein Y032_0005g2525 [Ancylostoma ceylanicum]
MVEAPFRIPRNYSKVRGPKIRHRFCNNLIDVHSRNVWIQFHVSPFVCCSCAFCELYTVIPSFLRIFLFRQGTYLQISLELVNITFNLPPLRLLNVVLLVFV